MWREVLDGLDVTRLGPGGEPTPLQVFEPTVSERSHGDPPVHVGHDLSQKVCFEQEDMGSLSRAKEGTKEGTPTRGTRSLPRSGLVQQELGFPTDLINTAMLHGLAPDHERLLQAQKHVHFSTVTPT